MDFDKFFTTVYGTGRASGNIDIVTRNPDTGALSSERWLKWPDDRTFVSRYCELRANEDVYFSVAMFMEEYRSARDKNAVTNVLWADADTCKPENFKVYPSVVITTSPGRYHCLWCLDHPYSASDVQNVAHALTYAHRNQGCDIGWTQTKILRVPGTSNLKRDEPFRIPEPKYTGEIYDLNDISRFYPSDTIEKADFSGDMPEPITEGDPRFEPIERILCDNGLRSLFTDAVHEGQSWSERLWRLEMDCFRAGMSKEQVFQVTINASCNKYMPQAAGQKTKTGEIIPKRDDPYNTTWKEVLKAASEFHTSEETGDPTPLFVRGEELPEISFLNFDERQVVSRSSGIKHTRMRTDADLKFLAEYNPGKNELLPTEEVTGDWVSRWFRWSMRHSPDQAPIYARSLAWSVLASILSPFYAAPLAWGDIYPNLWLMILGDTTRTHKSTALSLMLRTLHKYETITNSSGDVIDIGSDATVEALLRVLGKRSGRSSLIHTDEINGFFKEVFYKRYRMGTLENYTQLYDGNVPILLRASDIKTAEKDQHDKSKDSDSGKNSKSKSDSGSKPDESDSDEAIGLVPKRATTRFQFIGVGIRSQVAQTLTTENFLSGFLLRMAWAVADPKPYNPGDSKLQIRTGIDVKADYDLLCLVEDVAKHVPYGSDKSGPGAHLASGDGVTVYYTPTAQVIDRLSKLSDTIYKWATDQQTARVEIITASAERLRDMILKMSVLDAIMNNDEHDRSIRMPNLLRAMAQGEEWFKSEMRMLGEISTSEMEKELDDLEEFIVKAKTHRRTEQELYRRFPMLPRDLDSRIHVLIKQGRIRRQGRYFEALNV